MRPPTRGSWARVECAGAPDGRVARMVRLRETGPGSAKGRLLGWNSPTLGLLARPDTAPEVLVRMAVIGVRAEVPRRFAACRAECAAMAGQRTLVDRIWDDHVVAEDPGAPSVLAIDLHLVHEVTSPQAFTGLRRRGLKVRHPERTVATADHSVPTTPRNLPILDELAAAQVAQLETNCREFGIPLHGLGDPGQGIVHVIGPQLGLTQPGMTIVCGDSHTSTHGAFGALAFGIGTSEVEMVLATQCLLQRRPKTYEVRVEGRLAPGVSAKDVILALLARIGVAGGTGHVFEYRGPAIEALSMDQRMTICNMSIEGGARAGLIAPDDTTFEYLAGRTHAPHGAAWDEAVARWRSLPTDDGAAFHRSVTIDAGALEPMVTYGTNPGMGLPISARVPDPAAAEDDSRRRGLEQALTYMDLQPGQPLLGQKVDVVFIGSCTNGRISDLRLAAAALKGRHVADGVRLMVVPGSDEVKREAEREGLHEIFRAAGADWREAGCSMCIAMNGDQLSPGQYAVSTSNRNFEGRQGKGGRTFLASPLTAAASAVAGAIADPRRLPGIETLAAVGGR
jgi:3-isopropylmalate/(R)-2-methylmalate dehydratase large subunit